MELRDKNASVELMGKHHGLWTDEIKDPEAILSELLGIPKHIPQIHNAALSFVARSRISKSKRLPESGQVNVRAA